MLISGRIWKDGSMWLAESEIVDVCTQGRSRKDALAMLADAFETLIDDPKVKITVEELDDEGGVTIESNRPAVLAAFVLQRLRLRSGRSLSQVAESMGRASKNAYARYEQGDAIPTIEKFEELLRAVSNDATLIIGPRKGTKKAAVRRRKRRAA
ncbi:MAG TPA: helix-turn-helix transcriptional regulator [Kofleriaceae bacterium]|nr:helix-turn-helix transcriptional regulator [Kofleriaceae bacterium]